MKTWGICNDMFGGLIPADDRKQQLRTIRTVQAIGTGLIQSLVALFLFFAGGFRLSFPGFLVFLVGVWAGHIFFFYLLIRSGINRRFKDPKKEIRSILSRADKALYLAKNSGRNCIKLEINA
jgi:GGDEF domain-containing protein